MDRIAIVSDIHGNVTALEAVLADIAARGIATVYNLGDVAGKGPRGALAAEISRERCAVTVRGNWEHYLTSPDVYRAEGGQWWHAELGAENRDWLAGLPGSHDVELSGRRIRLFHASATSEFDRVHAQHTDAEFDGMFQATPFTGDGPAPSVVGYGDIHAAYVAQRGGRTLLNVGSVGNPLDETTAAYVVVEGVAGGSAAHPFGVQIVRVPYDVDGELAVARRSGMPQLAEYAHELRTAVYRGARIDRPAD
ncbi:metallophosphoesterase [Beutenbergia cavernae DSM 12333]|uniref:Metallophosphoesterase n=1 Tax=Beutenbergia cavernae (strain ATCC BAA-8 / DSM 12333 / CCUG 43141 / JCM 11478 / NBRC 16432 / NCIMB 13614 / HKI 0122) TaxID=471853 RepID=C5C3Z2_BEUC1|nr:metallophosphoesterase family protein [Beutenbergia cavernae]ACQ79905.1 metallophosphoesterase [Beutenbergia cavernae DSM 12333]